MDTQVTHTENVDERFKTDEHQIQASFDQLARDTYTLIFSYLAVFPDIMNLAFLNKVFIVGIIFNTRPEILRNSEIVFLLEPLLFATRSIVCCSIEHIYTKERTDYQI